MYIHLAQFVNRNYFTAVNMHLRTRNKFGSVTKHNFFPFLKIAGGGINEGRVGGILEVYTTLRCVH
mgnify:CR=1 FL=1